MISLIIPVYNHADTLRPCLLSLVRQTYRPLETIIVNDGSTDNFSETMEKILTEPIFKDLNIKLINQSNQGGNAARNHGFRESQGELVFFCDADIIAKDQMLEKLAHALQKNPQASYAYSQFKFGWKKFSSHVFDPGLLKKVNYINTMALIRRQDFVGFDESIRRFQDWDLWLTMLEQNKTGVLVPEILYQALVGGRIGISNWLPRFMYRLPWKTKAVKKYEAARKIITEKHHL